VSTFCTYCHQTIGHHEACPELFNDPDMYTLYKIGFQKGWSSGPGPFVVPASVDPTEQLGIYIGKKSRSSAGI